MNRLVVMMYLFSWSLRFVSLAGERKLTTSNHILYVFCLSHDFFFLYPPTYSLPLDLVCIFGHAFSRMQNSSPWRLLLPPVVRPFWGRHIQLYIHFRQCWWQTRELMPPKLRSLAHPVDCVCSQKGVCLPSIPPWESSQKRIPGASCPACRQL